MTVPAAAPRTSSWWPLLLAVAAFTIVPLFPSALRVVLPITETIALVVSALAVCAIVGWWRGGSLLFALVWVALTALTVFMLSMPLQGTDGYSPMVQGWTLMVAALFGLASILAPQQSFMMRALVAVGISMAVGALLTFASPGNADGVRATMRAEYSQRAEQMVEGSNKARSTPGWPDLEQKYPVLVKMFDENNARLRATPEWSVSVVPALLAIESLLALALAWAMYHRLSPVAIGPALGGVREFRFNDQLIWGLAVGATIAFLPPFRDARNAGFNLLLFFGTLYLLRGVGVLSWVSRGRGVATVLVLMTVFAFPLVGALAFCVGVGDTWMDWRNRVQSANV